MANLSFLSLKSASNLRDHDDKQRSARHRSALCLILEYLKDSAFLDSADTLLREAKSVQQDISSLKVCDNMDLGSILLEFECSYLARLQKKPRFVREMLPEEKPRSAGPTRKKPPVVADSTGDKKTKKTAMSVNALSEITGARLEPGRAFPPSPDQLDQGDTGSQTQFQTLNLSCVGRLKAALETYSSQAGSEMYDLAVIISREMFLEDPNVHWEDIKGMDDAKRLVKEAVVYPVKYPELFQGILAPWRGLLLTGPPGTGKTMLAKAVATECKTAFFNITASTVVSKWRGESEKLVRVLFDLARKCAPTCIFLDELDSLMSQRGENNEHEGSRRMKTEILIQMDGLQQSNDVVFVLAASNLPWELDSAMIRRLEKRVFVDLPNSEARQAMFQTFLPAVFDRHPLGITTKLDYATLAGLTAGYSGSDIHGVCKETAMRAMRKVLCLLDEDLPRGTPQKVLRIEPIVTEDVEDVLRYTRPVETENSVAKYREWKRQFEAS